MNLIHQGFLNIGATGAVCKHNKQTWPLFLAQQDWENKVEWAREWMKIGREGAFPRAKRWIRNKTLFCDCFTVVLLLSTNKNVHASTETCRKKYLICVNLARIILSAVSLVALCVCVCVCMPLVYQKFGSAAHDTQSRRERRDRNVPCYKIFLFAVIGWRLHRTAQRLIASKVPNTAN